MAKGAKDIAFDKERAKLKKEIRELNETINNKEFEIEKLKATINEKEGIINEQKDWIERLLEYTELTPDELKEKLKAEKASGEAAMKFNAVMDMMGRFFV